MWVSFQWLNSGSKKEKEIHLLTLKKEKKRKGKGFAWQKQKQPPPKKKPKIQKNNLDGMIVLLFLFIELDPILVLKVQRMSYWLLVFMKSIEESLLRSTGWEHLDPLQSCWRWLTHWEPTTCLWDPSSLLFSACFNSFNPQNCPRR